MADDWGESAVEEPPSVEVKLFGRWNPDDVQINDISLAVSLDWNNKHKILD